MTGHGNFCSSTGKRHPLATFSGEFCNKCALSLPPQSSIPSESEVISIPDSSPVAPAPALTVGTHTTTIPNTPTRSTTFGLGQAACTKSLLQAKSLQQSTFQQKKPATINIETHSVNVHLHALQFYCTKDTMTSERTEHDKIGM